MVMTLWHQTRDNVFLEQIRAKKVQDAADE
jgi:hypothetical protein